MMKNIDFQKLILLKILLIENTAIFYLRNHEHTQNKMLNSKKNF